MDYIREELLRQRAVLARLLLGQTAEEAEREEEHLAGIEADIWEDTAQTVELEHFRASRALAAGERFRRRRGEVRTAEAEAWAAYSGLDEELPEAALRRELGEDRAVYTARTLGEADTLLPARYAYRVAEAPGRRYELPEMAGIRRIGAAPASGADGFALEYGMGEVVRPAVGETADARELSRVFQRDARRYDGGFTLY